MSQFKCSNCECELDEDSIYPEPEGDGDLCEECYYDMHFQCALCEEREYKKYRHQVLVVFDPEEVFLGPETEKPGLYLIKERPYYADGMVEGFVYNSRVEWLAPLPDEIKQNYYPAGHLCRDCIGKTVGTEVQA